LVELPTLNNVDFQSIWPEISVPTPDALAWGVGTRLVIFLPVNPPDVVDTVYAFDPPGIISGLLRKSLLRNVSICMMERWCVVGVEDSDERSDAE